MRRRASDHAVLQSTASIASHQQQQPQMNGGDPMAHNHNHNGHRKASTTPSLKSQRSIYSKVRAHIVIASYPPDFYTPICHF